VAHPSVALEEFHTAIESAERLAKLERRYKDPPSPRTAQTAQALRGGFCVLAVGSFERFLSEAFAEHLASLVAIPPPVPFADLPEAIRLSTVFESLELAMRGPRHGRKGGRAARLSEVITAAGRIVVENVDPEALAQTKGNPDSETVRRMFKSLGVQDAFADTRSQFDALWLRPEASTFVSDKLDQIVNARHVVAHSANALAISRTDLQDWPRFLRVLATVIDERLAQYVANVVARRAPP
jgi:hypothetical protein